MVLTICWRYYQKRNQAKRCYEDAVAEGCAVLHLLPEEQTTQIKTPSITSVTFYNGVLPTSYLSQRVKDVLQVNPFLTSTLRQPNVFCNEIIATYKSNMDNISLSKYCQVVSDSSISHNMPYLELLKKLQVHAVKIGTKCINRDEVLFKVTLIAIKANYYALVVSLNHTLGDGHTFYKISGMLSEMTTPYKLICQRNMKFGEEMKRLSDPKFYNLLRNPLIFFGILYNYFRYCPLSPNVCVVDKNWVEAVKANHKDEISKLSLTHQSTIAPYLTTNDIISSWISNITQCDYGAIVVNLRSRICGFQDTMAGNYFLSALFHFSDMSRPCYMREMMIGSPPSLKRYSNTYNITNTLCLLTIHVTAITNMASSYEGINLPGGRNELHLQLMDLSNVAAGSCIVIFKCNEDDTGILCWSGVVSRNRLAQEPIISHLIL